MKTYFDNNKCTVVLDEMVRIDDWTEVIDLKKLGDCIKGLKLLGKEVKQINLVGNLCLDLDTPYYHKYDEELMNSLYCHLSNNYMTEVQYKNNRLYIDYKGNNIILPLWMDNYDNVLNLELVFE